MPAKTSLPPAGGGRLVRLGRDAHGGEVVEQLLVLGVLEELVDARRHDRADLGGRFQLGERGAPQRVEGREPLGEDLGHARADVADGQAGEEAVERPVLRPLDRRDQVLGRLLAHPLQVGQGRHVEPVEVGQAPDQAAVDELLDQLLAQAVDVHGVAVGEVREPTP